MSEKTFIWGIAVFTIILIGGAVVILGNSSKANIAKNSQAKSEVSHTNFDFKSISYSGGNVKHSFPVKNVGKSEMKIFNMKTSCMCTTAYLKTNKETGPSFGMPGHASPNSSWVGTLRPGEEGSIVVVFDPTAHGPEGIGPLSRLISFETNDPNSSYVEFSIQGVVVKD
ncbi:MAG: DUF1573 domain-containing protein [Candidatus Levybacteria bacterium]|nr:DUF1573 domain-containing protein [Candidatus Levybacteria bacterium]